MYKTNKNQALLASLNTEHNFVKMLYILAFLLLVSNRYIIIDMQRTAKTKTKKKVLQYDIGGPKPFPQEMLTFELI